MTPINKNAFQYLAQRIVCGLDENGPQIAEDGKLRLNNFNARGEMAMSDGNIFGLMMKKDYFYKLVDSEDYKLVD